MDVEGVLKDISSNILIPNTEDEEITRLYKRGTELSKDMASDIMPKLRSLKDDKLH
jgi:hypothetical protein